MGGAFHHTYRDIYNNIMLTLHAKEMSILTLLIKTIILNICIWIYYIQADQHSALTQRHFAYPKNRLKLIILFISALFIKFFNGERYFNNEQQMWISLYINQFVMLLYTGWIFDFWFLSLIENEFYGLKKIRFVLALVSRIFDFFLCTYK